MRSRRGRHQRHIAVLLSVFSLMQARPSVALPGDIVRVSNYPDGSLGSGLNPAISGDGRYVAFASGARLVPSDANGTTLDVYLHDRDGDGDGEFDEANSTSLTLVSVTPAGSAGAGLSGVPSISSDGRLIAFASAAADLVAGDTNGQWDVFVRDTCNGAGAGCTPSTTRESLSSAGAEGNGKSVGPSISGDGRFIAFESLAYNLVVADVNEGWDQWDVFLRDRASGVTKKLSQTHLGSEATGRWPRVSQDGSTVVFVAHPRLDVSASNGGVHAYDRASETATCVSKFSGECGSVGPWYYEGLSVSGSGRFVAYAASARVFLADRLNPAQDPVNLTPNGEAPVISEDGRFVAFASTFPIVPSDTNGMYDVYVIDVVTRDVTLASTSVAANSANSFSYHTAWRDPAQRELYGIEPALSADGSFVAFNSVASNLVAGVDNNATWDIFVKQRGLPLLQYFALGDGTAAGQGLASGDSCGRNSGAYAFNAERALQARWRLQVHLLACAGALASGTGAFDLPAQVGTALSLRDTRVRSLVSLSVGWTEVGLATPAQQRQILCDKDDQGFAQYVESVADSLESSVRAQAQRLLADGRIQVSLNELYQPFNRHPQYLDNPAFVGGNEAVSCDPDYVRQKKPRGLSHKAVARASEIVRAVNDRYLGVVTQLSTTAPGRIRLVPLELLFSGHEGAASPSGFCGAEPPAVTESWVQWPDPRFTPPYGPGDCLYPNNVGSRMIGEAVAGNLPDLTPVADTQPPRSFLQTPNRAVLVRALGDVVYGSVVDERSGVKKVQVAFTPLAGGTPSVVWAPLICQTNFRSCLFDIAPPDVPGVYTVRSEATDFSGNSEGLEGPQVTIIVL